MRDEGGLRRDQGCVNIVVGGLFYSGQWRESEGALRGPPLVVDFDRKVDLSHRGTGLTCYHSDETGQVWVTEMRHVCFSTFSANWTPAISHDPLCITLFCFFVTSVVFSLPCLSFVLYVGLVSVTVCCSQVELIWQDAGEFLCVRVDRQLSKIKKTSNLEIFHLHERDFPVHGLLFFLARAWLCLMNLLWFSH